MNKRHYWVLACMASFCGCTEQGGSCDPACDPVSEVCTNGVCEPKTCDPACNPFTEECVNGACVEKTCDPACDPVGEVCERGVCKSACDPVCEADEACVYGVCEPKTCDPACEGNDVCVNGECVDPNACSGKQCKDNMTYCDVDAGVWARCELGTGCHLGYCVEGLGIECEPNTCSEDGLRSCVDGKWSSCHALESCVDGECLLSADAECAPGTCGEAEGYFCNDEGKLTACAEGFVCKDGDCVLNFDQEDAMLWTVCNKNSDCAIGECIFNISTSRVMSNQALGIVEQTSIPLSQIDSRIPAGYGVCSADCTKSASKCEEISSGKFQFSCQVMVTGDSPYPPKDFSGELLNLPFHKQLDLSKMEIAPYASLCRPKDVGNRFYSETFCGSCNTSLECAANEVCQGGACMPKCTMDEMCPIGFSCVVTGAGEDAVRVCSPDSGTCNACVDLDGDGQGYGNCARPGFDCDPIDPDTYYTTDLPKVCTHDITDTNCNGKIDTFELLGSPEHCRTCNDECYLPPDTSNITRSCELYPDAVIDDAEFASFNPNDVSTHLTFCLDACSPGWADCDGNASNGCERQLAKIEDGIVKAMDATSINPVILHSIDYDGDLHGSNTDPDNQFYCCGANAKTAVCYAMPNTRYNEKDIWYPTNGAYWDNVLAEDELVSYDVSDCDDNRANVNSGADICDGLDNDCNPATADGHNDQYFDSIERKWIAHGQKCNVYSSTGSVCNPEGSVTCDAQQGMVCKATSTFSTVDNTCNIIDEDCDGTYNEHYQPTTCYYDNQQWICDTNSDNILENNTLKNSDGSINLCKIGIKSCVTTVSEDGVKASEQVFYPFKKNETGRPTDFYGDGIDSNCDGYDYDAERVVYINKIGDGTLFGDDKNGDGSKDKPYATLDKAFENACFKKGGDADYTNYCADIFIAFDMKRDSDSSYREDVWATEPILVPTFSGKHSIANGYQRLVNSNMHTVSQNAQGIKQSCLSDGCLLTSLLADEQYPPKETVRVYGGFEVTIGGTSNHWPHKQTEKTSYHYKHSFDETKTSRLLSLIKRDNTPGPISVKFSHMEFEFSAKEGIPHSTEDDRINGLTMAGLACGTYGCLHLTFDQSTLSVVGPQGVSEHPEHASNILYGDGEDSDSNGVNGGNFWQDNWSWNACKANFLTNRSNNACLPSSYSTSTEGNNGRSIGWLVASSESYYKTCPDGRSPRGGAPGSRCCKSYCEEMNYGYGRSGNSGGTGGTGGAGKSSSVNTGGGCGEDSSYWGQANGSNLTNESNALNNDDFGGNGGHGDGGYGGTFKNKTGCTYQYGSGGFYVDCDASRGNGGVGQSGGGGGGGAVYHCYDRYDLDDAWVYAGGGGAGGCGGRAGRAGGTGTSVVGLILVPPKQGTLDLTGLSVTSNGTNSPQTFISLEAGAGGVGQEGQQGRYGGFRGYGFGFANVTDNWIFGKNPKHCHKSMAGGIGGTGGGGGGGAGGLAGHAYPLAFICNRNVKSFNTVNATQFENCGFKLHENLYGSSSQYYLSEKKLATAGTDGTAGNKGWDKDKESELDDEIAEFMMRGYVDSKKNAEENPSSGSEGGTGGNAGSNVVNPNNEPGAGRTGDFKPILMLHNK